MAARLTPEQIQRAWTDQDYFNSLTPQQQAQATRERGSTTPQGIADAQNAAGVTPAIPPTGAAAPKPDGTPATPTTTEPLSTSLRYPKDIGVGGSDYMIFDFYDYVPPFKNKNANITLRAYSASSTTELKERASGYNQIILYMPEGVSVSYKANWDGKKFGNIAAGILAGAGNITTGDIGAAFNNFGTTGGDAAKRLPAQVGAATISAIIGGITGDSVVANDIFSSVGGQILNPNAELIFGGHDLRTFTFTYKLVPYNSTEAGIIFGKGGIIETFKRAMLPSFAGDIAKGGTSGAFTAAEKAKDQSIGFIKNPKLVQPFFMCGNGPHPFLPRLKACTITDFDVNYTADGVYAAHVNGYPAAAEISISLIETKLIYSEDIGVGY